MTARELIAELGGYRAAGRILEASPYTVRGWLERNRLPEKWAIIVKERLGVSIEASP